MKLEDYDFEADDFDEQLKQRIGMIKMKSSTISINFVGNPFVDAGIYGSAIIQKKDCNQIVLDDVLESILNPDGLHSLGLTFAIRNFRTKAISKILFNNPLNQAAYGSTKGSGIKKSPNKAEPSPLQERLYRTYLIEFLRSYIDDVEKADDKATQCIICGRYTIFDFEYLETTLKAIVGGKSLDKRDDFGSGPTRTWIPLMGTTSAIQALPGFSEANIICGKCLVLSQFLPQFVDLQNGLLTLYQSPNHEFVLSFYRENYSNFNQKHQSIKLGEKLDITGSDAKDYFITNLLKIIRDNVDNLTNSWLNLWKFDNYGTDPHIETIHLPNRTLQFLYECVKAGYDNAIKNYIQFEESNNIYSTMRLFNSIESSSDYFLFYPHTKYQIDKLAPQPFYELYQLYIRKCPGSILQTVITIVIEVNKDRDLDENSELSRLLKERNPANLRSYLQPIILDIVRQNIVSTREIIDLLEYSNKEVPDLNIWKLFQYYLHPKLSVTKFNYDIEPIEIRIDDDRYGYLRLISSIAQTNLARAKLRSSFSLDNYLDTLSRMNNRDIRKYYVSTGKEHLFLSWDRYEELTNSIYSNEIRFYLRLFSIDNQIIEIEESKRVSPKDLRIHSGLHPNMVETLDMYIKHRIQKIGEKRTYSELVFDLTYENYTSNQFYYLLENIHQELELEYHFNDYHFFQYEMEYTDRFKTGYSKSKTKFSWSKLRDKLILYITQYQKLEVPTLEQQLMEERK